MSFPWVALILFAPFGAAAAVAGVLALRDQFRKAARTVDAAFYDAAELFDLDEGVKARGDEILDRLDYELCESLWRAPAYGEDR